MPYKANIHMNVHHVSFNGRKKETKKGAKKEKKKKATDLLY